LDPRDEIFYSFPFISNIWRGLKLLLFNASVKIILNPQFSFTSYYNKTHFFSFLQLDAICCNSYFDLLALVLTIWKEKLILKQKRNKRWSVPQMTDRFSCSNCEKLISPLGKLIRNLWFHQGKILDLIYLWKAFLYYIE
jgi:hypothetical protein